MFTRNGENAKLYVSGRDVPSLDLNLKREKSKWILLDDAPKSELDRAVAISFDDTRYCIKHSIVLCYLVYVSFNATAL